MKDEPHSHKKATVVLVAVLLLAYVGSYLWMRQRSSIKHWGGHEQLVFRNSSQTYPSPRLLDYLYWPLIELDGKITGRALRFADAFECHK